jgi:hypothetical protein
MKLKLIVGVALCSLPVLATAGVFVSGNELIAWSKAAERLAAGKANNQDTYDAGRYMGFILGNHDLGDGLLFCTPNGVKPGQLQAVFAKYAAEHPERWAKAGAGLMLDAFQAAFPCPDKIKVK